MKTSFTKTILLVMIAMVSIMMVAQIAKAASIAGSKHDLRSGGSSAFKGDSDQVCIYCHTPHNANATPLAPLWNHASTATATYTLYGGAASGTTTLNATMGQPSSISKACLSCHDGSVAADSYKAVVGTKPITSASAALLGTNLSNDHPISFTYDTALVSADAVNGINGLVTPASASLVVAGIPLFTSKLECASCHTVHDNANTPFLRFSNVGSALCLKCHIK
jgi:predicted CXXCH cytochrome family protein